MENVKPALRQRLARGPFTATGEEGLATLDGMVAHHPERFALREKPEILWTRSG